MRLTYHRGVLYVVAAIAVAVLIALLVGWNLILVENYLLQDEHPSFRWVVLSLGCLAFAFICVTVLGLTRYLIRTDERQTFQQLLLDSVSHELKSPLASMKLLLETMQMRQLPVDKQRELRQGVLEELERLSHLVDHMLEAGREGSRRRTFEITKVDVREVVDRAIDLLRLRWGDESFTLNVDLDGCPEQFPTDAPALQIAVFNLLDNAVKYSQGRGDVTLRVANDWDWLSISVSDSGIGILKRDLRRVFARFYRAETKRPQDHREGVGLGLFVVRELVRRLGGRAWAESKGQDRGSTFHLRIPAGNLADEPVGGRVEALATETGAA